MTSKRTLILGESKSGKTHLIGQIFGRTRSGSGLLRLQSTPVSLKMLEGVLDTLAEGRSAAHTPAGTYSEIELDLVRADGGQLKLTWPDYAGEQITEIINKRALRREWANRVEAADSWTLLIRLSGIAHKRDALTAVPREDRPLASEPTVRSEDGLPTQMRLIELLQILRHRRVSSGLSVPYLTVMLTCADELPDLESAREALKSHLPILDSMIDTNWPQERWACWAISSLGRSLHNEKADAEFAKTGPERHGYIIAPDRTRHTDLTLPFATMMDM